MALGNIDDNFIYFLNNEGFITGDDVNSILNPVSILTAAQKAQKLVRLIKDRVELSPESYGVLIAELKRRGKRCEPIVKILEEEYAKQMQAGKLAIIIASVSQQISCTPKLPISFQ